MNERQQYIYGYHALKTALMVHPESILKVFLQQHRDDERMDEVKTLAENTGISIQLIPHAQLDELIGLTHHQGMAATYKPSLQYHENDLPELLSLQTQSSLLLVLDGVQDPHNLGACLRSANAFDVQAVIAPKNRAVGLTSAVRKVACGAAEVTPFVSVTNLARTLTWLKKKNYWLVGMVVEGDISLSEVDLTGNVAIIMGGEENGLRSLTRKHCDYLAHIPMQGVVGSLNVSVATGICLYEALRQRNTKV